jgi:hypothetical protein
MHPVLDEDPAALGAVPEPVLRTEPLVCGVILEGAAQDLTEKLRVDERLDLSEEWVVALHQVGDEETPRISGEGHISSACAIVTASGFLDDDVLARMESATRLLVMQKWRRSDVDEMHVRHREQHVPRVGRP